VRKHQDNLRPEGEFGGPRPRDDYMV
jgi:hypothetical protein